MEPRNDEHRQDEVARKETERQKEKPRYFRPRLEQLEPRISPSALAIDFASTNHGHHDVGAFV
jgi:hypothetical protein